MRPRIGLGGSGLDPVPGFTLVPEGQDFAGLYVCDACGWHVLAVDVAEHGKGSLRRCEKAAGGAADELAKRLPEIRSTKHGYGYGRLVFDVDSRTHVKLEPQRNGRFKVDDLYMLDSLTADDAEKLIRFIAELRKPKCKTCDGRGYVDEQCESAIAGMTVDPKLRPICDDCEGSGRK